MKDEFRFKGENGSGSLTPLIQMNCPSSGKEYVDKKLMWSSLDDHQTKFEIFHKAKCLVSLSFLEWVVQISIEECESDTFAGILQRRFLDKIHLQATDFEKESPFSMSSLFHIFDC